MLESVDGYFLLCRNALRKTLCPKHRVVPGCHIEQSFEAVRELLEENGIKAAEVQPICANSSAFVRRPKALLLIIPYHESPLITVNLRPL
jgi:hypothetical protein